MMRCHRWLHVAHSIAHREKVQPPRGSIHLTSSTQGSLLSSATPGYRKYNPGGVASTPTIYYRTTTGGWCMTWHLSSRHNAGCADATTWDCAPHGHLLPNHAIEIVRIIAIYHHAIMRGVTIPQRRIECRMDIHCQATA